MSMKQEQAFQILQAMSDVDQELLERSEKTIKPAQKVIPIYRKWGGICAACLCLVVLGSTYYGIVSGNFFSEKKSDTASQNINTMQEAQEIYNPAIDNAVEAVVEGGSFTQTRQLPEWLILEDYLPAEEQTKDNKDELKMQSSKLPGTEAEEKQLTLMEVTAHLPEGYSLVEDYSDDTLQQRIVAADNGTDSLWMRMTNIDVSKADSICEIKSVITMNSDWEEQLPEAEAGEYIQLAFWYHDGTLAEYYGCLSREELLSFVESITLEEPQETEK